MSNSTMYALGKELGYFLAGIAIASVAVTIAIKVYGAPFQTKALATIPAAMSLYAGYKIMTIPRDRLGDPCE